MARSKPAVDPLLRQDAVLNMRLPAEMYDALVEIAREHGVPVAHVVRSAIRQWLADQD